MDDGQQNAEPTPAKKPRAKKPKDPTDPNAPNRPHKQNKLTTAMKCRIVTLLACMEGPSHIRKVIKDEFNLELTLQTIVYYDPTIGRVSPLGAEWAKMFHETRDAFIKNVGRTPIMQKAFRGRKLQHILNLEEERGNTVGMLAALEQAAKEDGGAFTNRREHSGPAGAPIPHTVEVTFVKPSPPTAPTPPAADTGSPPASGQQ